MRRAFVDLSSESRSFASLRNFLSDCRTKIAQFGIIILFMYYSPTDPNDWSCGESCWPSPEWDWHFQVKSPTFLLLHLCDWCSQKMIGPITILKTNSKQETCSPKLFSQTMRSAQAILVTCLLSRYGKNSPPISCAVSSSWSSRNEGAPPGRVA